MSEEQHHCHCHDHCENKCNNQCQHKHQHENTNEHCHCHDHNEQFTIPYSLSKEQEQQIEQLLQSLSNETIHEIISQVKENKEILKFLLNDNRINSILQFTTQFIFPTIQITETLKEIISFIHFISTTELKFFIFAYNIPQLFIPLFFKEETEQSIILQLSTIYMNLMEDETSMMMLMKYQLIPIIIIWSEFGDDSVKTILLQMLLRLTEVQQIVSFICQSIEKSQQLVNHLIQLKEIVKENESLLNLINDICKAFSEKNEFFKSIYEKI